MGNPVANLKVSPVLKRPFPNDGLFSSYILKADLPATLAAWHSSCDLLVE